MLNHCVNLIHNSLAFGDLHVIGLTGSIGRGEKDINDANLNDIDFFVVARTCNLSLKHILDDELKNITNTKYTDVEFISVKQIKKKLKCGSISQSLFDLINGHKILFSKFDYFESARKKSYNLDKDSSVVVLLTRLWCLVGPYQVIENKIKSHNEAFCVYQLKKAYTAIIDSVLIIDKLYTSPDTVNKNIQFEQTLFYSKNKIVIDYINSMITSEKYTPELHFNLISLYNKALYKAGIKNLNYISFPFKKIIIKSLYSKDLRCYINRKISEYKTFLNFKKILYRDLTI